MTVNEHVAEVEQLKKRVAELESLLDVALNDIKVEKQKSESLEIILTACRDHIFMYDRFGRYIYASPASTEALCVERDKIIGKTWRELGFSPAIMERFEVRLEKVFLTGKEVDGETAFPSACGERFYGYSLVPLKDSEGNVNHVVATVRDITEKKLLEKRLVERSKILEAIFTNKITPMAIMDCNFNFIRVNEAYAEIDDREVSDFSGRNYFDFYPSDAEEVFRWVVESKKPSQVFARPFLYHYNPERGVTYWDWALIPMQDEAGQVEALLFFPRDVTRAVLVEKALRDSLTETRQRNAEVSALLKSSRAVLEYSDFREAARAIFECCSNLLGSTVGYFSIKNKDGDNEVLYADPGLDPPSADSPAFLPVKGILEEARRTKSVTIENNLRASRLFDALPEGNGRPENILCAPLMVGGESWGLMVFGNKPGGFTENDVMIAAAFSKDASIALYNSKLIDSLRHSEEHFRSVVQSATDAIITINNKGIIFFWNDAASHIFGYSYEEAVGSPLSIIMPERFHQMYLDRLSDLVDEKMLDSGGRFIEGFALRRDGSELPVEVSLSKWFSASDSYCTGIVRDVTQRKQAEEDLLKLASIVESTDDAIIGISLDGNILTWNRGAESIYGYSAGEVKDCPVFLIFSPWNKEEVLHILDRIRSGQHVEHYDAVHVRKDSKYIHVSVSISPVKNR